MTYNNFVEYVRNKCNYETIYSDGEGRVILVITLLDAYTMAHRAPKDWVGLTDEEIDVIDEATWDEDRKSWGIHDFAKAVETKLKEKNCG